MSNIVNELVWMIRGLTAQEFVELRDRLNEDGGPDIGVREPREPLPQSGAAGAALPLDEGD